MPDKSAILKACQHKYLKCFLLINIFLKGNVPSSRNQDLHHYPNLFLQSNITSLKKLDF